MIVDLTLNDLFICTSSGKYSSLFSSMLRVLREERPPIEDGSSYNK